MFNIGGKRGENDFQDRLRELETLAYSVTETGGDAQYLNQAGDLCVTASQPVPAIDYYGQAIDSYVKSDRFDAATAVCKKIIRLSPQVVRARCTITWLAIGKGFVAEAQEYVNNYLLAAEVAGREVLARAQVKRMSAVADAVPLRLYLAERLLELGDEREADHLFGMVFRERNLGMKRPTNPQKRWGEARRGALLTTEQLG